MSAEYTVPALREAVEKLRSDATALLNDANIEATKHVQAAERKAAKMRASADRIAAVADSEELAQRQAARQEQPVPCQSCGGPLVRDELGWRHMEHADANGCPGPSSPVPAPPTAPFETVPEGEVAQP